MVNLNEFFGEIYGSRLGDFELSEQHLLSRP